MPAWRCCNDEGVSRKGAWISTSGLSLILGAERCCFEERVRFDRSWVVMVLFWPWWLCEAATRRIKPPSDIEMPESTSSSGFQCAFLGLVVVAIVSASFDCSHTNFVLFSIFSVLPFVSLMISF